MSFVSLTAATFITALVVLLCTFIVIRYEIRIEKCVRRYWSWADQTFGKKAKDKEKADDV